MASHYPRPLDVGEGMDTGARLMHSRLKAPGTGPSHFSKLTNASGVVAGIEQAKLWQT
jgi:hypothetical protein